MNTLNENNVHKALDVIYNKIPDKSDWKTTTSKLFKFNIVQFLSSNPNLSILELGAAQGHTTQFLTHLSSKIYAVDNRPENAQLIKNLDCKNVEVICDDIYDNFSDRYSNIKCDISIIDAIHDYEHVSLDISTSLKLGANFLIFDDYGMFPEVKKCIDDFITQTGCSKFYIGSPPGSIFENTNNKILQDWEGIICFLRK